MENHLKAAIFDVDGLILDSEAFYARAWTEAFNANSKEEYRVDNEVMMQWFFDNLSGKKIGQLLDVIQKKFPNNDIPKIYKEYRKLFAERIQTESIEVMEGFFNLVNYLKDNEIRLAIASTSSAESIKNCFKNSNIDISDFEVIVSGNMVSEYKPSPEPYLKACEMLNVNPDNVVAFEDSESGLFSASNANIKCFLIPGRAPISDETKKRAFAVCNNLADTVSIIEKTFFINSNQFTKCK